MTTATSTETHYLVQERTSRGWYDASEKLDSKEAAADKMKSWLYAEPSASFQVVKVTTTETREVVST